MANHQGPNDGSSNHNHPEIGLMRAELASLRETFEKDSEAARNVNNKIMELDQRLTGMDLNDLSTSLRVQIEDTRRQVDELRTTQQAALNTEPRHEHAEIQALRADVISLNAQGASTAAKLVEIDNKLNKHERGLIGGFYKAGIILGVFGLILSGATAFFGLPKAIKEFRSKPQTKMVSGWPLELSYDPSTKKITFAFAVKVANDGGKADTIKEVRASFRPNSVAENQAHFLTGGIKFTEKGVDVATPFEVGTSSPRELFCMTTTDLGNNNLNSVIQSGQNHLNVRLIGDDGETRGSANYCYWVATSHIKDFTAATSVTTKTYVAEYPGCQLKQ